MKKTLTSGGLALLVAAPLIAGAAPPETQDAAAIQAAVAGNEAFAWKLYGALREGEGNLCLSPYSLRTALAMTFAGARGRTAEQMREVLALHAEGGELHESLAALERSLLAGGDAGDCELHLANSLWGQEGAAFVPAFLETIERGYGAGLRRVDFARATERARAEINRWVAGETEDRIDELLKPGDLTTVTMLVLANAIAFDGAWPIRFDPKNTRDLPFHTFVREGEELVAKEISVPTMYQTSEFGYRHDQGVQVLELPYSGGRMSMVILLPDAHDGLSGLEKRLSGVWLGELLKDLPRREMAIRLPRFEARTHLRLEETLSAMGMADAFDGKRADFSGMSTEERLWIDAVVHESVVQVDEEGTKAAGATAVMMKKRGLAFHADRPFVFLIRDRETGATLFLGRVVDPTKR